MLENRTTVQKRFNLTAQILTNVPGPGEDELFIMVRRIVFSILVVWALVEAIHTARGMPTSLLRIYAFFSVLVLAMLLMGLLFLLWEWVENKLHSNGVSHKA